MTDKHYRFILYSIKYIPNGGVNSHYDEEKKQEDPKTLLLISVAHNAIRMWLFGFVRKDARSLSKGC